MDQTNKVIQIFKAGKHTAMSGDALSFSEADLQASAAAYDPAKHEAPLVVGHPKHDAPAYGWVSSLSFNEADQSLEVTPDQVNPDFAEMHAAGSFKKRSASFYHPDSPVNPVPGVYYLKHVGFLGAQPPAIKGLKSAEFAENEDGVVTVEFGESDQRWAFSSLTGMLSNLREWLIEKNGREEADKLLPRYAIEDVDQASKQTDQTEVQPSFSEPTATQEKGMSDEEKAAQAKREADLKTREDAVAFAEQQQKQAANKSFVTKQIEAGKVLPADEDGMLAFMAAISAGDTVAVEFGEGESKTSTDAAAWFKGFVERQPKQVDFGEHSRQEQTEETGTVSFAAPDGYSVDASQMEMHNKILAYAEANKVDYTTAAQAVGG